MKKLFRLICFVLVFSVLFTIPVFGKLSQEWVDTYLPTIQSWQWDEHAYYPGSRAYWTATVSADTSLPEPMLGDANIDGKVDATDALFALNFGIHGNWLTVYAFGGAKKTLVARWKDEFDKAWNNGTLKEVGESLSYKLEYCVCNSAFFADVNKDIMVDAADALEILKYAVGKQANFSTDDFTYYDDKFPPYPWVDGYTSNFYADLKRLA